MKKRILVIVEKYLESGYDGLSFVHARLVNYPQDKFEVVVLSFSAKFNYQSDGIEVVSPNLLTNNFVAGFDIILSHAPNLRNHLRLLIKFWSSWHKVIFFIHGHEALTHHRYYPRPYGFVQRGVRGLLKKWALRIYDPIKLSVLNIFFRLTSKFKQVQFIFVSRWMQEQFVKCVGYQAPRSVIVANPCHPIFEKFQYDPFSPKIADFVTIRSLDNSKYAVDLVRSLALKNPNLEFHVYGCGRFFDFYSKPANLVHINRFLRPEEIPSVLNQYRMAIMPTRLDAQGVMACEMATYGIPILTTDLGICREMLSAFPNTFFIDENIFSEVQLQVQLAKVDFNFKNKLDFKNSNSVMETFRNTPYSAENTTMKEIDIITDQLHSAFDDGRDLGKI